ncbi:toll/interleukin-1 receptor domain-containing protein [Nannocystis bainbridge]|uniref:Toll/interleukin-1 receptor domain-containing protein n=1 Tax=Nannocystis bainbridge TaxID=2995303 RepID=A0ABT5E9F6_9BACT|nr:toll/interleukin-1 receptor domain-containing protein [Nannocystis bainbridge]MDC0722497.1 toll/interleukin-1 receptor domain-containing protein [Nannocystis bainbridge]
MASYGEVTVREILDDRKLRLEIAAMLDMTERAILRDLSGEEEHRLLRDFYDPVPGDLETMSVSDARGDVEVIAKIARHTNLTIESVDWDLENTHGRTLLPKVFDFVWLPRPRAQQVVEPPRQVQFHPVVKPAILRFSSATSQPAIFGSYSHKDRKFVDAVRLHLKPLERDNSLEFWDDSKIKTGAKWRDEIQMAIERASAAVLFISANFLASDFIHTDEIPPLLAEAKRRGTVILPLIVGHCLFTQHPVLSTFQAFNDPNRPVGTLGKNERDKLYVKLATQLASLKRRDDS